MSGYLRPHQREDLEREVQGIDKTLSNPHSMARIEDPGVLLQRKRKLASQLEYLTPPDTSGAQRDALTQEERELREWITEGMPSDQEMRRCPPGAVGKHQRWEKFRAKAKVQFKDITGKIKEQTALARWKDIVLTLSKGDVDKDVANFERYRPRTSSLNMDNSVVDGKTFVGVAYSPEYEEGWTRVFGTPEEKRDQSERDTEYEQLKQELADLKALIASDGVEAAPEPRKVRKQKFEKKTAKCGRKIDVRGLSRHELACSKCKAAA